jgi:NAD(P)H-hydrate epimerase
MKLKISAKGGSASGGKNEKLKIAISHFAKASRDKQNSKLEKQVELFAQHYNCTVLLKGPVDVVCSKNKCVKIPGGNSGMTKGGTGDVLAGLVAALYCKNNDPFLVAQSASFINKKAGESLFKKAGYYFNASDLADEIPRVMKELII